MKPNEPMEATQSADIKFGVRWVVAAAASPHFVSQLQPDPHFPTVPLDWV